MQAQTCFLLKCLSVLCHGLMLTIDYEMRDPHDGMLFRPVVTRSILYLSVIWGLVLHVQGALW